MLGKYVRVKKGALLKKIHKLILALTRLLQSQQTTTNEIDLAGQNEGVPDSLPYNRCQTRLNMCHKSIVFNST